MRRTALLVVLGFVFASCSDGNDRTYAFDDALRCFRGAGYQAMVGGETDPPTPESRDFEVWDKEGLVYALIFFDSVDLARERDALPPIPQVGPDWPQGERERRGNVSVLTWHPSGGGISSPGPGDRKTLDRCLPED
jgi:hypothetical protein